MSDFGYLKQLHAHQTGMVYKFIKQNDVFIHTMIEGDLLYQLGFTPVDIIGKTLQDFLPEDYANSKHQYYLEAWEGNFVHYESEVNGNYFVASLRPIFLNDEVVEVVGSCINLTRQLNNSLSPEDYLNQSLSKTISENILYDALQRTTQMINQTLKQPTISVKNNLTLKNNSSIIFIPLTEIIFIERLNRKSVIHTMNKQYETYESLFNLSLQLDTNFSRCHKSYIVNVDYLEMIEQIGQKYVGHFKNYDKTVKISVNMLLELKKYKSY
ncbi:MAG TPA: LytTR family transcriptional regulator DNA-binding domain-containing protein [Ureibacillus sp.]|nr:LytTR family transcriptional regulator DNA-binding domain-containing protein [Ureibacillus sp.]